IHACFGVHVVAPGPYFPACFPPPPAPGRGRPARRRQRPFDTRDSSRNLWWLALITMGEGWHNNHHRHAGSARLGFRWWQLDLAWLGLKLLAWLGLVTDLKPAPTKRERPCESR
ncbi:MAG: hypothetical protein F4Y01_08030, partial [Gammaproteobacteria bacterium]|nr:hypothetical protein [Gammaproteobacteria bacterium]